MLTDGLEWCDVFISCLDSDGTHSLQSIHWLILTAPIHCRASIDSHSDGTHSLQSIHWLSFWRHPFTVEHPLTLILTAPIHCRASIDSHSDGTHSLQSIHWLSFWRHPFTAEHPLLSNRRRWRKQMKKQTPLYIGWPEGAWVHLYFWWTILLRSQPRKVIFISRTFLWWDTCFYTVKQIKLDPQ